MTQLGDRRFAIFRSGFSKSRRAFLNLLQAGRGEHLVNDAALARMRAMNLGAPQIEKLAGHGSKRFSAAETWQEHLVMLGFDTLKVHPNPF